MGGARDQSSGLVASDLRRVLIPGTPFSPGQLVSFLHLVSQVLGPLGPFPGPLGECDKCGYERKEFMSLQNSLWQLPPQLHQNSSQWPLSAVGSHRQQRSCMGTCVPSVSLWTHPTSVCLGQLKYPRNDVSVPPEPSLMELPSPPHSHPHPTNLSPVTKK